jgi:beta-N-acetylhexosaminidase
MAPATADQETEIKRLAGRLVIGRLPGLVLDERHRQALLSGTLGGITLFKENAASLGQLIELTGAIIEASFHPPVLTVDQEGGAVQRFENVLSSLPSPMALAALNEPYTTAEVTSISARQLKTLGFNMLLAPTLDLQTNPRNPIICTRAYGDNAASVTAIGAQVAAAIEAEGLIAVGKHFPGHGATVEDSHLELACVDKSRDELRQTDLEPFAELASRLKAILIGHIWLPQIMSEKSPATLSHVVIEEILRGELKFAGLVVSDDMIMKAITHGFGLGEACVQALLAGVDLLLVCGTYEQSSETVEAIADAVASGRLSRQRLEEAVARLDLLINTRPEYLKSENVAAVENFAAVIGKDSAFCRKTSARAICVVRGKFEKQYVEAIKSAQTIIIVAPAHPRYPMDLAGALRLALVDQSEIIEIRYPLNPGKMAIDELTAGAAHLRRTFNKRVPAKNKNANILTIFLSYRSAINSGQDFFSQRLAEVLTPAIHVATDSPYDSAYLSGLSPYMLSLATLDPSDQAMFALADVLTGEIEPQGKTPVIIEAGQKLHS